MNPGMAFGTGLHATTAFCLQAIEDKIHGPNILDIGTGSGILSIACAVTIPQAKIIAVDIDDNAITNAKQNIQLNHLEKRIELILTDAQKLQSDLTKIKTFDTVLSNLTAETIIELLPLYNKLLNSDGILILAGIIEERLTMLQNALAEFSFHTINKAIDKGWVGLVLTKS